MARSLFGWAISRCSGWDMAVEVGAAIEFVDVVLDGVGDGDEALLRFALLWCTLWLV